MEQDNTNEIEVRDCKWCRNYLLCKHPNVQTELLCENFDNIYEGLEDDEPVINTETENEPNIVICSQANEHCEGCPCAVPHEFNELLDTTEECEDANGQIAIPIKVK
jgi:hypothetical protein